MKIENLSPLEFCIIVCWIRGWTISKIHLSLARRHGKTENAIRGIINKLPKRRQDMTQIERQAFLDEMKANRIDDGMLPADYFVAKMLASDQKMKAKAKAAETVEEVKAEPEPEPDPNTRAGRKELKRRRDEARRKKQKEEEARARREFGEAPRGIDCSPLEYLHGNGGLSDPKVEDAKEGRANNAMRRYDAGVTLRSMMESIYGSGVKSPDYEAVGGGGGAGVVIHAVVAENIKNLDIIKGTMPSEWFQFLEQMLLHGRFVWRIPSKKGSDMVLAEVRQALDKVSVFLGTMPPEASDDDAPRRADRNEVRQKNRLARDLIAQAQRQAR